MCVVSLFGTYFGGLGISISSLYNRIIKYFIYSTLLNYFLQLCCQAGCVGVISGVKWGDNIDPCPMRITELLEDPKIEIILGTELVCFFIIDLNNILFVVFSLWVQVFVLKLLIGPMTGFNLRNLTWHGFLRDDEFPPRFLSLIFAICVSLPKFVVQRWKMVKYGHTLSGRYQCDVWTMAERKYNVFCYGRPPRSRNWWRIDPFGQTEVQSCKFGAHQSFSCYFTCYY